MLKSSKNYEKLVINFYAYSVRKTKVQEIRKSHKDEIVKKALQEYDENLEKLKFFIVHLFHIKFK